MTLRNEANTQHLENQLSSGGVATELTTRTFYRGVSLPPLTRTDRRERRIPLSLAQLRLWFLSQLDEGSERYHEFCGIFFHGNLNQAALRGALDRLVARHEVLRTTFISVDGVPVQKIEAAGKSHFSLVEHDLRGCTDAEGELRLLMAEEVRIPFDLQKGPLIRGRLVQFSNERHSLLVTIHHIVSDGWSMGILQNELSTLYEACRRGKADPLPELEVQYADYSVWQREWIEGEVLRGQSEYWKTALSNIPEFLELPLDRPRGKQRDYRGSSVPFVLDEELTAELRKLSRRHGTTLYMTLLAGWAALLARLSGQTDIVVGVPTANRQRIAIEKLIGFFVNMLAIRVDVSGSPTVRELLARVKKRALDALHNQDIPFERVVDLVNPVRSLSHTPIFQTMFSWQNTPGGRFDLANLETEFMDPRLHVTAKFDLTLSLQEAGDSIAGGLEYATSLFERETIERYLGYFRNLLAAMVGDDTRAVDRLPMLSDSECHRVLYEWNHTKTEFPSDKCVHELFEQQVARDSRCRCGGFRGGIAELCGAEPQSQPTGPLSQRAGRQAR